MKVRMTQFDFTYRGYVFEGFLRNRTDYSTGWTVIRREESRPNIPPCKEILTDRGWENTTTNKGACVVFFDVEDLVANCESQVDTLRAAA